jgi:hypothetical protein
MIGGADDNPARDIGEIREVAVFKFQTLRLLVLDKQMLAGLSSAPELISQIKSSQNQSESATILQKFKHPRLKPLGVAVYPLDPGSLQVSFL